MASFKSIIKKVDKTELYFKQYQYKASITSLGIMYVRGCKTMERFERLVNNRYQEWTETKNRYPHGWYREPLPLENHDLLLIKDLINIKNNLKDSDVRFRHENDNLSLYTNDDMLIQFLMNHDCRWQIEQANVSPAGVKYFKKDPPAKYRAYLTNNKMPAEFCQEMLEYVNRTPDLQPCGALYEWLHRRFTYHHSHVWLWNNHFIDYNDERNLMMMKLMFPQAIGKTYKLEKKPQ